MTQDLFHLIICSLTVYGLTLIFTQSEVFFWARRRARMIFGLIPVHFLVKRDKEGNVILIDEDDMTPDELYLSSGYDAASCRMCVGLWVTLMVCAFYVPAYLWLPVYGLSYFLATQER